jgi:hypothetical protein
LLSALTLAALGLAVSSQGCDPNQGEGERCDRDTDCQSGLTCLSQTVCCPPDPKTSSSQDCRTLGGGTVTDTGPLDTATATDSNPATDSSSLPDGFGATCKHTSDCTSPLVCLPGGSCGYVCNGDRDCASGEHCDCASHTCGAGTGGGSDNCSDAGGADTSTPADTTPADTGAVDTAVDDTTDAAG